LTDIALSAPACTCIFLHRCRNNRTDIPALPFCKVALRAKKPDSRPYPKNLKNIGDHLKKKRLDMNIQQKELAEKCGVTVCTIRNWEKNRSNPSLVFMPKIVQFLGYIPYEASNQTFGEQIAAKRRLLGLRQKDLATSIGADPCTVRSWEKGRHGPSKRFLKRLADFFAN